MTKLFSLLKHAFAHHRNSKNLENYISTCRPKCNKDIQKIAREFFVIQINQLGY